jgi:hypothetical protein
LTPLTPAPESPFVDRVDGLEGACEQPHSNMPLLIVQPRSVRGVARISVTSPFA